MTDEAIEVERRKNMSRLFTLVNRVIGSQALIGLIILGAFSYSLQAHSKIDKLTAQVSKLTTSIAVLKTVVDNHVAFGKH